MAEKILQVVGRLVGLGTVGLARRLVALGCDRSPTARAQRPLNPRPVRTDQPAGICERARVWPLVAGVERATDLPVEVWRSGR